MRKPIRKEDVLADSATAKRGKGHKISERDRLMALQLKAEGHTHAAIAKALNVSLASVDRISSQATPEDQVIVQGVMNRLAAKYALMADAVTSAITEEDLEKASLKDKAVVAGVFTDKYLVLSGKPTQVVSHVINKKELEDIKNELKRMEEAFPEEYQKAITIEAEFREVKEDEAE